jgi:hypothetical protein
VLRLAVNNPIEAHAAKAAGGGRIAGAPVAA